MRKLRLLRAGAAALLLAACASLSLGQEVLKSVPGDAIVCIEIRNFQTTMGTLDQFLTQLSPTPVGATATGRMQLGNALGDPNLTGVDLGGDMAFFAMGSGDDPNRISVFGLLPVTDYQQFTTANPHYTQPDANGVARIGPRGLPVMQAGQYALLAEPNSYAQITAVAKAAEANSLSGKITEAQTSRLGKSGVWVYGDIQGIMKLYGPRITAALEKIPQKIRFDGNSPRGQQKKQFAKFYSDYIKAAMSQTKDVAITLNFSPDVINVTKHVRALPGTRMAQMFVPSPQIQGQNRLINYLPKERVLMMADKINKPFTIEFYSAMLDAIGSYIGSEYSPAEKTRTMDIVKSTLNTLGDTWAAGWYANPGQTPPFSSIRIISITDSQGFKNNVQKSIGLMQSGMWQAFFKKMNVQMQYSYKANTETYKGVAIDTVMTTIRSGDPNTAKNVKKTFGGAIEQKIATVENMAIVTGGYDASGQMKAMIDKLQGAKVNGAPDPNSSLAFIADANEAQFVGTLNHIRLMQVIASLSDSPFLSSDVLSQTPTQSEFAFAGTIGKGEMTFELAIPKLHLMEIKSAFEMTMQQRREQMERKRYSVPESNSTITE